MADEKVKFLMRISPDADRRVKTAIPLANCRSQNEFVEKSRSASPDPPACHTITPSETGKILSASEQILLPQAAGLVF